MLPSAAWLQWFWVLGPVIMGSLTGATGAFTGGYTWWVTPAVLHLLCVPGSGTLAVDNLSGTESGVD